MSSVGEPIFVVRGVPLLTGDSFVKAASTQQTDSPNKSRVAFSLLFAPIIAKLHRCDNQQLDNAEETGWLRASAMERGTVAKPSFRVV